MKKHPSCPRQKHCKSWHNRKSCRRQQYHSNNNRLRFRTGEVYLFHPSLPHCPTKSSLWGVFDRTSSGVIPLESSSRDLQSFRLWHPLPAQYRYCRLATRTELREYVAALMWYETHKSKVLP